MAKAKSKVKAEGPKSDQGNGSINKLEAVRQALSKMGDDAKPQDIHDFVMENYHLDLPRTLIYTYKASITKKAAEKNRPLRNPGQKAAAAPETGGITVDDIRAIKEVAGRIGADKVRELVDVLCR